MKLKNKVKILLIIITLLTITGLSIGAYYFYRSKTLIVKIDNNIKVSINSEVFNTDYIKVIANGKIITKKEQIDTTKVGEQSIKIKVKDYFDKEKEYTYKINVYDNEAPTITFKNKLSTEYNTKIDLYKDVTVVDNSNEKIDISIEGNYDIKKPGTYKLYYVAKDSTGNEVKEEFKLIVKEKPVSKPTTSTNKTPEKTPVDTTFTTSKGFKGYTKNGITYIDGILVANKTYPLPSTYKPGGLTKETQNALNKMKAAAAVDGLNIYLSSGYRSYSTQNTIYNRYVKRDGVAKADTYSARPGHSEHQTGLAFDVNTINDTFHNTPEAKWLAANCYKYGLILRYPKGKTNETGYKYESWHFRYVGVDLATKLYNNGDWITLESYFGITSKYN